MSHTDGHGQMKADLALQVAAEDWFARLHAGDCSDDERAAFARWRRDPACAAAYADAERVWVQLKHLRDDAELQSMLQLAMRQRVRPPLHRRWPVALAAAAAMVVALLVSWQLPQPDAHTAQLHATTFGETRTDVLPDGSSVTLGYAAEVAVALDPHLRRLDLKQGEALFDVQRDVRRPFVVHTELGEIQALGTRFMVRTEGRDLTVTLLHGSIAVTRKNDGQRLLLEPGERLHVAADGSLSRQRVDAEMAASWTRGRLVFRAARLDEALAEVNRYVRPGIHLGDAALGQIPISATVRVGDAASMATALAGLLKLQISQREDGTLVLHRG